MSLYQCRRTRTQRQPLGTQISAAWSRLDSRNSVKKKLSAPEKHRNPKCSLTLTLDEHKRLEETAAPSRRIKDGTKIQQEISVHESALILTAFLQSILASNMAHKQSEHKLFVPIHKKKQLQHLNRSKTTEVTTKIHDVMLGDTNDYIQTFLPQSSLISSRLRLRSKHKLASTWSIALMTHTVLVDENRHHFDGLWCGW